MSQAPVLERAGGGSMRAALRGAQMQMQMQGTRRDGLTARTVGLRRSDADSFFGQPDVFGFAIGF